jgi:monoamine oxidase
MAIDIAIIGAGCAGIGAAKWLMDYGGDVKVTVIEANGSIGGRARTWPDPQLPVDLGPQFIQDPAVNPWENIMRLVPDYQGEKGPLKMGSLYRIRVGDNWITDEDNKGIRTMNDQLFRQYEKAATVMNSPIMTGNSAKFCKDQQDIRLALGSSGFGAIAESTEPWKYLVSDQARQEAIPGDGNIYAVGGLGTVVEKYGKMLEAKNPQKLNFVLNTIVEIIITTQKGVTIKTSDKKSADFHFCIVTVPVGEVDKIQYSPPLSAEMVRALKYIRLGSYKKVAFRPTAFPVGDLQKKPAERDSIEENFEYFIYDEEGDGVWQYFRLPTDPTILICVTAGDFAQRLDKEPDKTVALSVLDLLAAAYAGRNGDFKPKQPPVVTNWSKAPHIHGAYSYTRYDSEHGPDHAAPFEAREIIARPHGRIYFAGEATYARAYGTIHGAYYSGQGAAQDILAVVTGRQF